MCARNRTLPSHPSDALSKAIIEKNKIGNQCTMKEESASQCVKRQAYRVSLFELVTSYGLFQVYFLTKVFERGAMCRYAEPRKLSSVSNFPIFGC